MEVEVTTDVATEPVTLAEMKTWMKFDIQDTSEDTLVTDLIKAAREFCEQYCNLSLGEKTIQVFWHNSEAEDGCFVLPYGPHSVLSSFNRIDQERTETTLTENSDFYRRGNLFWEISLAASMLTDPLTSGIYDYQAIYVAGYGATGCPTLPSALETAIKHHVFAEYKNDDEAMLRCKKLLDKYTRNTWLGT